MSFLGRRMLEAARDGGVALGGFDAFNMESAQAVVNVAQRLCVPVFLQAGIQSAHHMGLHMASMVLHEAKRDATVDVCVHLDHGLEVSTVEQLKQAVELGFESVMVDGSSLSLEDNIALTKRVVDVAHPRGACVEGEVGRVSRNVNATAEELARLMTDPDDAARFVESTGVDYLAVSVGSISGLLHGEVSLNLERLASIREKVSVPLVFHGGTGIPSSQFKDAIKLGVCKINVAHGFRKAFLDGIRAHLETRPDEFDPRRVLREGIVSAEGFLDKKMRQLYGLSEAD